MTYLLIAFTALVSITAFRNEAWFSKLQFNAYQIYHRKEIYRLLTHGFLHANWTHLIVNMLVLFFFGPQVEIFLKQILPESIPFLSRFVFLLFYFGAIIVSALLSLYRHKTMRGTMRSEPPVPYLQPCFVSFFSSHGNCSIFMASCPFPEL